LLGNPVASTAERPIQPGGPSPGPPWFEDLFKRNSGVLYRVLRRTCQPTTAEEVRQETWLRAWLHRIDLEPLHERQQRVWLLRTARRLTIDHARRTKARREAPMPADDIADPAACLDRTDEALDARRAVGQAAARLSPAERELLALRFVAELTPNEIAQVLGISKTAATSRLHRAMKAFERAYRQGGTR
jgi:RNA polymerase sigma-70 factor (ECF subfamily)